MQVYFDTNVLRYLSVAFSETELQLELRRAIVLSPVSAIELMSQLCEQSAAQAFSAVQAMWNWLPPQVNLLDPPPIFVRMSVAGDDDRGDDTFERMSAALDSCLHARSVEHLREASEELRRYLQRAKEAACEMYGAPCPSGGGGHTESAGWQGPYSSPFDW